MRLIHLAAPAMLALVLVGCGAAGGGPTAVVTATGSSSGAASAAPTGPVSPSGTVGPSAPGSSDPSVSGSPAASGSGPAVAVDPSLLAILPATVGGLALEAVSDPSGLSDPGLVASVDRMAQGFVVDQVSGDFAYASIVILRPGVFSEIFFRAWRDSFDEGACSQAGGVVGHAEAPISGRTTYIGRCGGGVSTYHVHLAARDAVVSVSSLGDRRFGEAVIAGLRP